MIKNMRAIPPWEKKEATKEQYDKLRGGESKKEYGTLGPINPGMKPHGPVLFPAVQDPLPKVEIEKRLGKLEKGIGGSSSQVTNIGDNTYEYTDEYTYIAYAAAISNVNSGVIQNQSDATGFSFSAISESGAHLVG